jgi:hypothetical protein
MMKLATKNKTWQYMHHYMVTNAPCCLCTQGGNDGQVHLTQEPTVGEDFLLCHGPLCPSHFHPFTILTIKDLFSAA